MMAHLFRLSFHELLMQKARVSNNMPLSKFWLIVFAIALSLSWLLPNHYPPWSAFHVDAWNATILVLASFSVILRTRFGADWSGCALLIAGLACVPGLQYFTGLISFSGQAWITSAYLLGLLLAVLIGQIWERDSSDQFASALFLAIGIASVLSVNLQLRTWLNLMATGMFDIWSMGLSGDRPYANLGQPNQLATLLLWGLLASAWAYITHQIRGAVALLMAGFLLIGVALTQSRTAWLGLTFFLIASWIWKRHWPSKRAPWVVTALLTVFCLYPFLLRTLTDALLLGSENSYFRDQIQSDLRLPAWRMFSHAVLERPWFGYGWTEIGHVQLAVATEFPALFPTFGQSHNLFLDLLLWLGLPLGLFVSGSLIWWFASYARKVSNASEVILVMFLGAVGIHAMLEFPLHYAYFLLPTGLVMGVLNQRLIKQPVWTSPRWTLLGLWLMAALLLTGIIRDYFKVESSFQDARFELAHIGHSTQGQPPEVLLLNQLRERINYMRYDLKPDMTPAELDWLQKVVNAYPGGGAAYKAARALALNQHPVEAQQWLRKICKISSPDECTLIQRVWNKDAQTSALIAAVPWPKE
jgi:hypothetical protein